MKIDVDSSVVVVLVLVADVSEYADVNGNVVLWAVVDFCVVIVGLVTVVTVDSDVVGGEVDCVFSNECIKQKIDVSMLSKTT